MIGIIGAMQIEIDKINEEIENGETFLISGITFTKGLLFGKDVVTAVCGVGKVFAAVCTEAMILKFNPKLIINTGVAGTLTDELSITDVAIAKFVVQHDMDTSPIGDPVGLLSGINVIEIPSNGLVCEKLADCVRRCGKKALIGGIASGDQFISDSERKEKIRETFSCIACEMEGGAIGHAAYINNVDFAVIRAISDGAGEDSVMDYPTFALHAANVSAKVVKLFVKEA